MEELAKVINELIEKYDIEEADIERLNDAFAGSFTEDSDGSDEE